LNALAADDSLQDVWTALAAVEDPEIPVLSIVDLGIVRVVERDIDGTVHVGLTPTYSGCPATLRIRSDVLAALRSAGFDRIRLSEVLAPAWSTDWISAAGRSKLHSYGIAPPDTAAARPACPRCGSKDTETVSEFGSTPCKALHRCKNCLEPFDRFKCI
jgi:ring-1,2-phenylacetyl-CoA epoxidase subunit PaaD